MPAAANAYVVGAGTKRDSRSHLQGLTGSEGPDRRGKTNGGKMKATANKATARVSKNQKYLIVESNGQTAILNANLIRYLFDIPYTRKDGTQVSNQEIFEMKRKAQEAYNLKIRATAG